MSITQAAEDLCLTQSAVSRQIRSLEEALGLKLLAVSYTHSDAADERSSVDLGGRRII